MVKAGLREMRKKLGYSVLALNVHDAENKRVFPPYKTIEKGGVRIAVLGHAYPHTAIIHPRGGLAALDIRPARAGNHKNSRPRAEGRGFACGAAVAKWFRR